MPLTYLLALKYKTGGFIFGLICYQNMISCIKMKSKHRETLELIFGKPVSTSLKWQHIEALFVALGAQAIEGRGSRVRFELNGVVATFHRPHPYKEAKPYQVRDVRKFLEQAGMRP
jgi:hypothetical protein